jgi:epoxide hydrolase 4
VTDETLRRVELAHRYADLGDVRLHYVEAGEGPLVLLLHGFPQFWYEWRHQIPALVEAGFRVVAPDMRGYNFSDKPPGVRAYRLELLARDVERLILACAERKASVVGHDWGAIVAWIAAMRYPERVGRLAILNVPHPARLLEGFLSPGQLLRSSYIFFFQIPRLPEAVIRAGEFALLRFVLRREPVRAGAVTAGDIEWYAGAMARPGAHRDPQLLSRPPAESGGGGDATGKDRGPGARDLGREGPIIEPEARRASPPLGSEPPPRRAPAEREPLARRG